MTRSSVISVRFKDDQHDTIQEYSKILNIKPSTLVALIVEDSIEEWVKTYSESAYKRIWKKN